MLKYNETTKVIYDNDEAVSDGIRAITADEIAGLLADGATVDDSAKADVPASGEATTDAAPATSDTVTSPVVSTDASPVASTATVDTVSSSPATETAATAADTQANNTASTLAAANDDQAASEQEVADAGVNTAKDVDTVTITPTNLGSVTGVPVTPDGTPVVEAQPQAVTVAGPTYPANDPAVTTAAAVTTDASSMAGYEGKNHREVLEYLLGELEGIAAMGKSEIQSLVTRARNAIEKL